MKFKQIINSIMAVILASVVVPVGALVNYEAGVRQVNGIAVLQDASDAHAYYYLPQVPRIAIGKAGNPEISLVKFIDPAGETSGGMLHMLVTFSLPDDEQLALAEALKKDDSKARLIGPVPLKEDEDGSFQIISATLADGKMANALISSGRAPLSPGSKAAVAASLSPHGATLLWESLNRPTSDVSVAVSAYYEASLPSFEARITADVSTVYEHFSKLKNVQEGYSRKQIRNISDELVRTGAIKIELLERLPEDTGNKAMQSLVDLVSAKLTETIFDQKTGFTAIPEKEVAVEQGQVKGRQKKGWLAQLFTSSGNQKYYSDNQYVMKERSDINRANFNIQLNRRSVVKVPVATAGNLSGLYELYRENESMFRVVNLADPAFQKRDVFFRIDGDFSQAFEQNMNFAAVSIRKSYQKHEVATGELIFAREDVRDGRFSKSWPYARLGEAGSDWLDYEYKVKWSIKGDKTIRQPANENEWLSTSAPITTIAPPLTRLDLEVDADRYIFEESNIRSASLEFKYPVFGTSKTTNAVLRATDAESLNRFVIFHDRKADLQYRIKWYKRTGESVTGEWQNLDGTYLVLIPPAP
ncbi:MAG: hypothetical protein JXA04_00195 [Gammaproteobacteria bacterium]|nr:hypothetical protein [Gammaproteobacteria bacterium]